MAQNSLDVMSELTTQHRFGAGLRSGAVSKTERCAAVGTGFHTAAGTVPTAHALEVQLNYFAAS